MSDYKPVPAISRFIYAVSEKALYMDCSVTVPLPSQDSLTDAGLIFNAATAVAEKKYNHVNDPAQTAAHQFKEGFPVKIIPLVAVTYTPNDKEGFKTALRKTMSATYTLKVVVNPAPGAPLTGGSGENTIDKNKDIDIT